MVIIKNLENIKNMQKKIKTTHSDINTDLKKISCSDENFRHLIKIYERNPNICVMQHKNKSSLKFQLKPL